MMTARQRDREAKMRANRMAAFREKQRRQREHVMRQSLAQVLRHCTAPDAWI